LSDGTPIGDSFQVNNDTGITNQTNPCVSVNGVGNFIITWVDRRNGNQDVYAQRYLSDGTPLGNNYRISNTDDMQQNNSLGVQIKYVLITEQLSFIPDNILNCCEVINISRPTKIAYTKSCKTKISTKIKTENITNIKVLHFYNEDLMLRYRIICDKIIYNLATL